MSLLFIKLHMYYLNCYKVHLYLFLESVSYIYAVGIDFYVHRTIPKGSIPYNTWRKFTDGTLVTKIIVHGNSIFGIGKDDNAVYQTSAIFGGSWTKVANAFVSDLAYSNGYLYGVSSSWNVWRTVPNPDLTDQDLWSEFTPQGGTSVTKIIVHGDTMFGIGKDDHAVYQTSATYGGSWTKVGPAQVTDLAYSNGLLYVIGCHGCDVHRNVPNQDTWHLFINGLVKRIIIHEDFIYGVDLDGGIMKTSSLTGGGEGGSWTQVTSPDVLDLGMMTIPGKCC